MGLDRDKTLSFSPVRERDEAIVRLWLHGYLTAHLEHWSRAYGLDWDTADIDRTILDDDLVARDWHDLLSAARNPRRLALCAYRDERPVGIVRARLSRDRYLGIPIATVTWLYVDPRFRGDGCAARLLERARLWMERHGVEGAEVFVDATNAPAVSAYERAGFRVADYRMLRNM